MRRSAWLRSNSRSSRRSTSKARPGRARLDLLHAIGHAYATARPGARIFYCSAERFMIEFVQAMRSNEMLEFKARLRGFDLLLVDDIQFIIGKSSTQEEFLTRSTR